MEIKSVEQIWFRSWDRAAGEYFKDYRYEVTLENGEKYASFSWRPEYEGKEIKGA